MKLTRPPQSPNKYLVYLGFIPQPTVSQRLDISQHGHPHQYTVLHPARLYRCIGRGSSLSQCAGVHAAGCGLFPARVSYRCLDEIVIITSAIVNRDAPVFIPSSTFSSALSNASLEMIWLVLRY
jgi:hypothetical protein